MKRFLPVLLLLCAFLAGGGKPAQAQRRGGKKETKVVSIYDIDTLTKAIPLNRQGWHDKINKAQRSADYTDGKLDGHVYYGEDSAYSAILTKALLTDVDHLQIMVENLPIADAYAENQTRIRYLTAIEQAVNRYVSRRGEEPLYFRRLITALREMIIARHENRLSEYAAKHADIYTMDNAKLLEDFPDARATVYRAVGIAKPMMMIRRLKEFPTAPFACDIIAAAARISPSEVFNYAYSTDPVLRPAIRRCRDSLVMAIVRITDESKAPLKAMSFLNDIYTGQKTIAEIDRITADQDLFYKNLVRLKIEGVTLGQASSTQQLQQRGMKYVRTMNDLHEESNPAIRFKCIDGFNPAEIYLLLVYGQDEIYTSSFLGAYRIMMERLSPRSGEQLLDTVHYDQFRTFIRMTAGYNTLDHFLSTMSGERKTALMKDFVANLEKGSEDELEDAVDVAEAFASIRDSALSDFLRSQVRENYRRTDSLKGPAKDKGTLVYGLLNVLFNTNPQDSVQVDAVARMLKLPPINRVPYLNLLHDSTGVTEQVFFYGDEDGKVSYEHFLANFKEGGWKVAAQTESWICYTSSAAFPVTVYANKPVQGEEGQDQKAQEQLQAYLAGKGIEPSMIVHRGHSYHLSTTIGNMDKPNKIVMLGSCGGYHNLGKVLDRAPDGQIISTKQTGTMEVNDAIIRAINRRLTAGQNVDWVDLWTELDVYFKPKGKAYKDFLEYIPPNRNLGAIFIKAYRRALSIRETAAENQ